MIPEIKTLIVEDDKYAANYLSKLLQENFPQIDVLGSSESVRESIKLINTLKPEIIFMDIVLTDGNAFQIFDKISYTDFEVIFVTSHEEYFKKAIEQYYAFHFTGKPINIDKIKGVVNKYDTLRSRITALNGYQMFSDFLKGNNSNLLIHVGCQHIAIAFDDIIKCEAKGNYTQFYTTNKKKYFASKSLKYYDSILIKKGFFKVNRSAMVNVNHIKSIYKKEAILLEGGDKIIISRRNKVNLNDLIKHLS